MGCELAMVVEWRLCDAAVAGEQLGEMESPKATCTINCAAARPGAYLIPPRAGYRRRANPASRALAAQRLAPVGQPL